MDLGTAARRIATENVPHCESALASASATAPSDIGRTPRATFRQQIALDAQTSSTEIVELQLESPVIDLCGHRLLTYHCRVLGGDGAICLLGRWAGILRPASGRRRRAPTV